MAAVAVSHVYPLGSRLNEQGRLEVGGCDVLELAREFGTPAYVYAEDDGTFSADVLAGALSNLDADEISIDLKGE